MIVADAFDAMTTNRVYKAKKTISSALKELEELSAKQFHPEVVSAAVVALKNIIIDTDISQLPKSTTEEQRFSYFYRDRLTGMFIIDYLSLILRYHIKSDSVYLYSIRLRHFTQYNRHYSWKSGDEFLVKFAKHLDTLYDDVIVFRVEGDDFIILSQSKRDNMKADVESFALFNNSGVKVSIDEKFIQNAKENTEDILEVLHDY